MIDILKRFGTYYEFFVSQSHPLMALKKLQDAVECN